MYHVNEGVIAIPDSNSTLRFWDTQTGSLVAKQSIKAFNFHDQSAPVLMPSGKMFFLTTDKTKKQIGICNFKLVPALESENMVLSQNFF